MNTTADRMQIILPGGSGKTLVGYHLVRQALLASSSATAIIFLPTLSLIEQTLKSYYVQDSSLLDWNKDCLCVCSKLSFNDVRKTTSAGDIKKFVEGEDREEGPRIIFSTYQSSRNISNAELGRAFDVSILDEAHETAGAGKQMSLPLHDEHVPTRRRVFMTGTPRLFTAGSTARIKSVKGDGKDEAVAIRSMDDEGIFGKVVHELSYREAIERNITAPIKVIAHRLPPEQAGCKIKNEAGYKARLLVDAAEKFGMRKVIAFSRTNERAQALQAELTEQEYFSDVFRVNGRMTAERREAIYSELLRPLKEGENIAVCNAKVMVTGFDLPDCDGVFISDRMESHVTILQAVARAARKFAGKKEGFVVVPVQVTNSDLVEQFRSVLEVVRAMVEQDKDLMKELRSWVIEQGKRIGVEGDDEELPLSFLERFELGEGISVKDLELESIVLELFGSWDLKYGMLKRYYEVNGDCLVPRRFKTVEGLNLGVWVGTQRNAYKNGQLSRDRVTMLEKVGFVWDPLAAEWEENFQVLVNYKKEEGDCLVPDKFKTVEGLTLGIWVQNMRQDKKKGKLSADRSDMLEEVGFVWDQLELAWEKNFQALMNYKKAEGNCLVPARFKTADGVKLGGWVGEQRKAYKNGQLSTDRVAILEEVGFVWDPSESEWEGNFQVLVNFKNVEGDCLVPRRFKTVEGIYIGSWVQNMRQDKKKGKLSADRSDMLEEVGFVWDPLAAGWEENFQELVEYKKAKGDCLVPNKFETIEGVKLGRWVGTQREAYKKGNLSAEKIKRLEDVGFVWDPLEVEWEENFQALMNYKKEEGDCLVPFDLKTVEGTKLGNWVANQRNAYKKKGKLSADRLGMLEEVGFVWDPYEAAWEENFQSLVNYKKEEGDCLVQATFKTVEGLTLGSWVSGQRVAYKNGKLSADRVEMLEEIGFVWDTLELAWEQNFQALVNYKKEEGDCLVPVGFKTVEGLNLGKWTSHQRNIYKNGKLSRDRVTMLEEVDFVWDPLEAEWERNFQSLVNYKEEERDCLVPWKFETVEGVTLGGWVGKQRGDKKKGLLSADRVTMLEEVGFVWDPLAAEWERNFQVLVNYKKEEGDCLVVKRFETIEGVKLGLWAGRQRKAYKNGQLSEDRVKLLEEVGFVWKVLKLYDN
ncbi:hypothetical protein TrST_g10508 [Triparma strigata]|uniref:Helicase n=1 Tax=Triparma strigata TaxID=1606541 RepID=A0A9W7BF24_9STRA|nr:hypothetical protein TrST_g10508 [Triparma strigata]